MMRRIFFLLILLMFACNSWFLRSRGDVSVVAIRGPRKATIALGNIENRDSHYDAYANRNLLDMLAFEMVERGYGTVKSDLAVAFERRRQEELKRRQATQKNTGDETADLLPEKLRTVAGETRPSGYLMGDEMLSPDEVRVVATRDNANYFLQGAISRTDAGNLLEREENFLVFLDVYNRNGEKVGVIAFAVRGNSLKDSPFMKSVCTRIAAAFDEQIQSGLARRIDY